MRPYRLDSAKDRLTKTRDVISRLGKTMKINISPSRHRLRLEELELTADHLAKIEEEKERIRAERERQRDGQQAQRDMVTQPEPPRTFRRSSRRKPAALHPTTTTVPAAPSSTAKYHLPFPVTGSWWHSERR